MSSKKFNLITAENAKLETDKILLNKNKLKDKKKEFNYGIMNEIRKEIKKGNYTAYCYLTDYDLEVLVGLKYILNPGITSLTTGEQGVYIEW